MGFRLWFRNEWSDVKGNAKYDAYKYTVVLLVVSIGTAVYQFVKVMHGLTASQKVHFWFGVGLLLLVTIVSIAVTIIAVMKLRRSTSGPQRGPQELDGKSAKAPTEKRSAVERLREQQEREAEMMAEMTLAFTPWLSGRDVENDSHPARSASATTTPRPEIIPSLDLPPHASDAFIPLHLENTGSLDAFNVFIAPLSSGNNAIKFAEIDRMKPNDQKNAPPIPNYPTKTRDGLPDLWDFLWRGQLSNGWKEVADNPRVVPDDEIEAIVHKPFTLPFTITYNDVNKRKWITRAEFRFGRDKSDIHGLMVKVHGVEQES